MLLIPVNAPDVAVLVWLLITLVLMLSVAGADELDIPVNVPVPESVPAIRLFVVMLSVPVPPVLVMPVQTPAPEVNDEQFWMVLPVIEIVPVAAFLIPMNVVTAVVVPFRPMATEFAVVVDPMVFEEIVKLPAAPAVSIPAKV